MRSLRDIYAFCTTREYGRAISPSSLGRTLLKALVCLSMASTAIAQTYEYQIDMCGWSTFPNYYPTPAEAAAVAEGRYAACFPSGTFPFCRTSSITFKPVGDRGDYEYFYQVTQCYTNPDLGCHTGPRTYCGYMFKHRLVDRYWLDLQVCPKVGNPIYPLTGMKRQVETLGNWLGRRFEITYDNLRKLPNTLPRHTHRKFSPPSLGPMWQLGVGMSLTVQTDGFGVKRTVQISRPDGLILTFRRLPSGLYESLIKGRDSLVVAGLSYGFYDSISSEYYLFDESLKLYKSVSHDGHELQYVYSDSSTPTDVAPTAGLLIEVRESAAKRIKFYYQQLGEKSEPRIYKLADPDGREVLFEYDSSENLKTLTYAGSAPKTFLYENSTFPWALTGVVGEDGLRMSQYSYDAQGRAISTALAGGWDQYVIAYGSTPAWNTVEFQTSEAGEWVVYRDHYWTIPVNTVVAGPLGESIGYQFTTAGGVPRLASQSQPAGSGCGPSASVQTLDANGNVASRDDFNGKRVCYAHDLARNLESTRVEGLAGGTTGAVCSGVTGAGAGLPAGSRKISTQWHPRWSKATKLAEPGRITTWVYNGQPDPFTGGALASCAPPGAILPDGSPIAVLCRKVEQASVDATGAQGLAAALDPAVLARNWSYAYDATGKVLSVDGPRSDVSDVTSFNYYSDSTAEHSVGDLYSMTDPLGKVTRYTRYNKNGQLLEIIDPNGVVTTHTFDARQRLTSTTVAGQTTSYTYSATGQLTRLTQPDANYVGYEYDAAQRLKALFDNLGNRVEYTLDNAGNRIAEQVKDSGGALRRQLTRSIDALGRVQQTVGER